MDCFLHLATMKPKDLPDSKNKKNSVVLDAKIEVHKWWLAAHQHFGKIIVQPSNLVYLEDQAVHLMVMLKHKQVKAS